MRIQRLFTKAGREIQDEIDFELRTSGIRNPDGSLVFEARNIAVPKSWSQVATDILAQKYLRRAGVPVVTTKLPEEGIPTWLQRSIPDEAKLKELPQEQRYRGESEAGQVFHRLSGCWTYWGFKHGMFDSEEDARAFYDELWLMLAEQMCAPNSPQWFNTGLHWAYGITGPSQGHWYVDPETGAARQSEDAYTHPQPHACFIQSIDDDLVNENGIMDLWLREARLFKYGSGTGTNFSSLRAEGEALSGGGRSSGLMSFLRIGDRAAGAIKSGGTTRRAAKMVCLDLDHPDIESFIEWKVTEEQKVAALVSGSRITKHRLETIFKACQVDLEGEARFDPKQNRDLNKAIRRAVEAAIPLNYIYRIVQLARQGFTEIEIEEYSTNWESEAYTTVSGQNSNNSVRIPNAFMNALEANGDWNLTRRTDGQSVSSVGARELWDKLAFAAWSCADPGVQFDTTINEWHTCPADGPIRASNPCSEYMFLDDTACNLASLNLMRFHTADGFDIESFEHACRLWTMVLEISVLMAQFPSRRIAELSYRYRTLGLGFANIGSWLMVNSIPYDSPTALAWSGALSALMTGVAYRTSAEMAAELGPFAAYHKNREAMLRTIRNHRRAIVGSTNDPYEQLSVLPREVDSSRCPPALYSAACRVWNEALSLGKKHGFRNAQTTVIAPTGTIGLVMDCDTTGIEPDFALVKFKKLAGGGYFKIINQSAPAALQQLGYSVDEIRDIADYCQGTGTLIGAPFINHESLKAKGFTTEVLDRLEASLESAFSIQLAFSRYTLGAAFCEDVLGFDEVRMDDPRFDILEELGFSTREIEAANAYTCGTMTIEGAPHLKSEHYAVFDCANRCGATGTRFIDHEAHVRILSAVQPFVSGAISKTINMPNEATVEEVAQVYALAHKSMLKAIAIYRDGSKLSQPLQTVADAQSLFASLDFDEPRSTPAKPKRHPAEIIAERVVTRYIAKRRRLPNRRGGYTQKASIGSHNIYLRTGEYEDGSLGEIFIDMHREGASFRSLLNCFAIAVSLGLQFGVPLEEYIDAFVFTRFEPSGIVKGHDNIKMATSVIDYIFRELGLAYLGRTDLVQVKPEEIYAGKETPGKGSSSDRIEDVDDDQGPYSVSYQPGSNGRRAQPQPSRGFGKGRRIAGATKSYASGDLTLEVDSVATLPALELARMDSREGALEPKPKNGNGNGKSGKAEREKTNGKRDTLGFDATGFAVSLSINQAPDRSIQLARIRGYEGDPCPECGNLTQVRNGTCLKCDTCGSTSGCG